MTHARRIVSLVPAATDIVSALGLGERVVGISHECDDPSLSGGLPRLTRSLVPDGSSGEIDRAVRTRARARQPLYELDRETLERLAPDLIVTQGLCDVCAVAEDEVRAAACALPVEARVLALEPRVLEDLFTGIEQIAAAAGVSERGARVVGRHRERVARVERMAGRRPPQRIAFLEWLDPPFGAGHWNPELIRLAGGEDPFGRTGEPARTISWEHVVGWRPEVVFVASCGHDVERAARDFARVLTERDWRGVPAVGSGRIWFADGTRYFSRPGPGLVDSLELLAHALDPHAPALPAAMRVREALRRSA